MEFLNSPFCAVCKQTIVEKIHSLVNPIDGCAPDNSGILIPTNDSLWFKGLFVKPSPNTLKTMWDVNSGQIAVNKDSVMIPDAWLMQGGNVITLTVKDTSILSKDTAHVTQHVYSVSWIVSYSTVGIKELKARLELAIFPNPASEQLNVTYKLNETAELSFALQDMSGRVVLQEKAFQAAPGEHRRSLDIRSLSAGSYVLAVQVNKQTINQQILISK